MSRTTAGHGHLSSFAWATLPVAIIPTLWCLFGWPMSQRPVLRSGIDVVLIECSVVGRSGRPIDDLRTADFTVTVGGTPRRVVSAQFIGRLGGERRDVTAPEQPAVTGGTPGPSAVSEPVRQVVLVADENSIRPGARVEVLKSAAAFVEQLAPRDKVAVVGLPWLPDRLVLTADRESIRAALGRLAGRFPDRSGLVHVTLAEALAIQRGDARALDMVMGRECLDRGGAGSIQCRQSIEAEAREQVLRAEYKADQSLGALLRLTKTLGEVPGPKTVVFLSGGMVSRETTAAFLALEPAFAAAQVRLYVLRLKADPAELAKPSPTVQSLFSTAGDVASGESLLSLGVERISEAAGGTTLHVPGSLEGALGRVAADLSASYLVGFEPLPGDFDGQPHDARVTVTRRGAEVRGRRRYILERHAVEPAAGDVTVPMAQRTRAASATGGRASPDEDAAAALDGLLTRAAHQLAAALDEGGVLAAEERSEQVSKTAAPRGGTPRSERRRMAAEYVLARAPGGSGLAVFRDVFEVDGKLVRRRDGRLAHLLSGESETRFDEAGRITAEGLTYDIGFAARNLALTLVPLQVLGPAVRPGFDFRKAGEERVGGVETWRVAYEEWRHPTFIRQNGADVPVEGAFWIGPRDGRVAQSRIQMQFGPVSVDVLVLYQLDRLPGLSVPTEITERYWTATASLESVARLDAFRRVR